MLPWLQSSISSSSSSSLLSLSFSARRFLLLGRRRRRRTPIIVLMPQQSSHLTTTASDALLLLNKKGVKESSASNNDHHFPESFEPLYILGGGSMGLLLAATLRIAFPSYPVRLLLRERHRLRLQQQDNDKKKNDMGTVMVTLEQPQHKQEHGRNRRRFRTTSIPAQIITNNNHAVMKNDRPILNLIITTKAFQVVDAIASIRHRLLLHNDDDDTTQPTTTPDNGSAESKKRSSNPSLKSSKIILLCNGALAVREELLSQSQDLPGLQPHHIHLALTTHGAYRDIVNVAEEDQEGEDEEMMHVVHAGVGQMLLPPSLGSDSAATWTSLWNIAGLPTATESSEVAMRNKLWCKLAANCVINPMTAIYKCTNGELPNCVRTHHDDDDDDDDDTWMQDLVAVAVGNENDNDDGDVWDMLVTGIVNEVAQIAQATAAAEEEEADAETAASPVDAAMLKAFSLQVVADTTHNKSSMLQDVLAKRRTEVDHLNGYVVQQGQRLGIETPLNAKLWQRIVDQTSNEKDAEAET